MSMNEEEEAVINEVRQQEVIKELKEKKVSSQKLRVYESDMEESDGISDHHNGHNSKVFPQEFTYNSYIYLWRHR